MIGKYDHHKITFTTPWGTYCYKVMSFSLNNVGATYQRAMAYILHDYMNDIVEDYMDDIIIKSKTQESHLDILYKILDKFIKYNVILNPKKYVFGVLLGKLLGFIVSKRYRSIS